MRPDQERITEWLSERAPQLADVYQAAIRLLGDATFPGRQHLICHAGRDIGNRVPDVIAGRTSKRVENTEDLDTLSTLWADNGLDRIDFIPTSEDAESSTSLVNASVAISQQVFKQMHIVVNRHRQGSQNNQKRAMKMVEAAAPENIGRQEVLVPLAKQWTELTRWFHSYAHAGLTGKVVDEKELQNKFNTLETYLSTLIGEFYGPVETLDEILEETNS
jgi:hypothetical protein